MRADLFEVYRAAAHSLKIKGETIVKVDYPSDFSDLLLETLLSSGPYIKASKYIGPPMIEGVPFEFEEVAAAAFIIHTASGRRHVFPVDGVESLGSARLRLRIAADDLKSVLYPHRKGSQ